ncbi:MAG: WYL domain-containing protein [Acidobacteria bacterium]|nr:WYL domain-containing protein [Acidobacteriota bacterium]
MPKIFVELNTPSWIIDSAIFSVPEVENIFRLKLTGHYLSYHSLHTSAMKDRNSKQSREHIRYLVRVFWIDLELRNHRYPNANTIAEHFEITSKTAQRTLDFMKDQLKMPIAYSAEHRGWYYYEPYFGLVTVEMTEGELITILLAEKLLRQYRGTALGGQIEQAVSKILQALTNSLSIDFKSMTDAYSFEAPATTEINFETMRSLDRAISSQKRISMKYYVASRGELSDRQVDPLHIRNFAGEWYLIAWDHLRKAPRDFLVSRIRELNVTKEHFDWPKDFNMDEYLNQGFGMIRGLQPIQVEIVFDEYQSRWMRERSKFHPTEEREELPDGRLRVRMQVTALDGVKRFVMQYGAHVEVIQPEELRKMIREEIESMQAIYNNRRTGCEVENDT